MTRKKIIGGALVAAPFVAVGALAHSEIGWLGLLQVFGGAGLIFACIICGVYLLND